VSASLWERIRKGGSRWQVRLALLLVVGIILFVWFTREHAQNRLTVENRSGQPIALLEVTITGQTTTFRDVASGADALVPLSNEGGQHFVVSGQLADGTRIRGQGTAAEHASLVVLPGGQIMVRQAGKG
jgi:hypothetical protein